MRRNTHLFSSAVTNTYKNVIFLFAAAAHFHYQLNCHLVAYLYPQPMLWTFIYFNH